MSIKTPIHYIGTKNIDLEKYNIKEFNCYCEPFGGSFTTGLNLIEQEFRGKVVYNDLDRDLSLFWKCIIEDYKQLYNFIIKLNNELGSIGNYSISTNKYMRAAAKYIMCQCTSMKGIKLRSIDTLDLDAKLFNVSLLLTTSKIEIYNKDYSAIIKKFNSSDTFLLVDPPYNCSNVNKYYKHHDINHVELYKILSKYKGKWLLTVNDCELFRELYKDFNIEYKERTVCSHKYTELYITNI